MRRRRVTVNDSRPAAWERTDAAAGPRCSPSCAPGWRGAGPARRGRRQGPADGLVPAAVDALRRRPRRAHLVVTMLRHPAEILTSARKSYGDWQADASRAAAWINVILETEHATRDARRAFVRYEDLLADWPARAAPRRRAARLGPALAAVAARGSRRSNGSSTRRCTATASAGTSSPSRRGCATWPRTYGATCSRSPSRRRPARDLRGARRGAGGLRRALRGGGGDLAVVDDGAKRRRNRRPPRRRRPGAPSLRVRLARRDPARVPPPRAPRATSLRGAHRIAAGRAEISVVVPIYNVEAYLEACLDSIAAQTVDDLEVVMVDDGVDRRQRRRSPRASPSATRASACSPSPTAASARRATRASTHAAGDFMAFLDSDDVLPPNAYELLLGALDRSGSDFATGNVHRLNRWGTMQSPFLAKTFTQDRLETHVTQFRELLSDRTAWNKLFRRSFWDAHGFASRRAGCTRTSRSCSRRTSPRLRRRDLRPRLPLADPRGRRPLDHPAPAGAASPARPAGGDRARQPPTSTATPRAREALVRRERGRRRPPLPPEHPRQRGRALPRAVPRARQRVPRRRCHGSRARCRRSSGSSGTSSAAG